MNRKLIVNVGDVIETNNTGSCTVVGVNKQDITVVFPTGFKIVVQKGNLLEGSVRDPYFPAYLEKATAVLEIIQCTKISGIINGGVC